MPREYDADGNEQGAAPAGGSVVVGDIDAESSTDGYVITSDGAGNADWEVLPAGGYTHPDHTGDVTSAGDGATTIAAGAVDLAMHADLAARSIMANATNSAAAPTAFSGAAGTVPVFKASSIDAQLIKNAQIDDAADIALSKMADQADETLLGNNVGFAGPPLVLAVAAVRTMFDLAYYDVNDTTGGVALTSGAVYALDTVALTSGDFSLASGEVTINKTGKFLVNVFVTAGVGTTTARSAADSFLQIDTGGGFASIANKSCRHYCRETTEDATTGAINAVLDITSGDKLRLWGIRRGGTATIYSIADMTGMTITELLV
jgi:hypothetical protein